MTVIRCRYWTGKCLTIAGNQPCKAGIDIRKIVGGKTKGWVGRVPCFKENKSKIKCASYNEKTEAEIHAQYQKMEKQTKELIACTHIFADLKNRTAQDGTIPCPVCGGDLHYSISETNGHMHAKCSNDDCVNFME